jgi:hypothetical protein
MFDRLARKQCARGPEAREDSDRQRWVQGRRPGLSESLLT